MQEWEYMLLTVIFGDNDIVRSVNRSGMAIFRDVKMSIVDEYMAGLKDEGWEVESVHPIEIGETYEFRKLME